MMLPEAVATRPLWQRIVVARTHARTRGNTEDRARIGRQMWLPSPWSITVVIAQKHPSTQGRTAAGWQRATARKRRCCRWTQQLPAVCTLHISAPVTACDLLHAEALPHDAHIVRVKLRAGERSRPDHDDSNQPQRDTSDAADCQHADLSKPRRHFEKATNGNTSAPVARRNF